MFKKKGLSENRVLENDYDAKTTCGRRKASANRQERRPQGAKEAVSWCVLVQNAGRYDAYRTMFCVKSHDDLPQNVSTRMADFSIKHTNY